MEFLERGELPGDALNEIGEALGLGAASQKGEGNSASWLLPSVPWSANADGRGIPTS